MDKNRQPGVSFDGVILKALHFERNPQVIEKPSLQVTLTNAVGMSEDKRNLSIEATVDIVDPSNKSFSLKATVVSLFSTIGGQENMSLEEFAKVNGPALLLPYVREIVANTTLRSGLRPVLIPPFNLQAITDSKQTLAVKD
jgi:preprotein translocase subunit SecB